MRHRCPDSVTAERLFYQGMALVDIAKKLKVPDSTVRRWKSTQHWKADGKKNITERSDRKSERSGKEKASVRKKGGAPYGNHNGKGAPLGSQRALKHGGYSEEFFNVMTPEEQAAALAVNDDPEDMLINVIRLYSAREYRLMKIIHKYQTDDKYKMATMQTTSRTEHQRVFDGTEEEKEEQKLRYEEIVQEKIDSGDRMPGRDVTMTTNMENTDTTIARLEAELTKVSNAKSKAIQALAQIRAEREKQESGGASDMVRMFIEGLPDMEASDG